MIYFEVQCEKHMYDVYAAAPKLLDLLGEWIRAYDTGTFPEHLLVESSALFTTLNTDRS